MSCSFPIHQGEIDVSPEEVDYNPARLEQLDAHFQKMIESKKIQGPVISCPGTVRSLPIVSWGGCALITTQRN